MKIIKPAFKIESEVDGEKILRSMELAARNCYKSEGKIDNFSHHRLIKKLISSDHHAMLEFGPNITVRFITDRGVSHELVRHRLCSLAQESTRYCNYGKDKFNNEITIILPSWFYDCYSNIFAYRFWKESCEHAEKSYFGILKHGQSPQQARSVLPNSLKTEILLDANIREWRHIFKLRAINDKAHPQIRQIMLPLLKSLQNEIPILFDDLKIIETDKIPEVYWAEEF